MVELASCFLPLVSFGVVWPLGAGALDSICLAKKTAAVRSGTLSVKELYQSIVLVSQYFAIVKMQRNKRLARTKCARL